MTEINKKLIVTIPARLAATRLPNKPLADIHGRPMIVHVWERVVAAIGSVDQVIVAAGNAEIVDVMQSVGGRVVLTDPDLPSGSDRVFRAIQEIEKQDGITLEHIINVQGDLPTLAPELVKKPLIFCRMARTWPALWPKSKTRAKLIIRMLLRLL